MIPAEGAGRSAATDRGTADNRKHDDRSTATAAQEARIIEALRLGPKTTDDLRAMGIYQASARVHGLRRRGYNIQTELFDGYAADGFSHSRLGRYRLLGEPDGQQAEIPMPRQRRRPGVDPDATRSPQ